MVDIKQLETALINADRAGDIQAAKVLAGEIQRQRSMASDTPARTATPAPTQPGPGALEKIGRGMMDPINGGAQLLERMVPQGVRDVGNAANNWLADKTGLVARVPQGGVDQMTRDSEREYESRRAAGGQTGFDGYRTIGNIVSPVNLAAAAKIPATVVGGIAGGGVMGALSPVVDENFWEEKAKQTGLGAAVGGAIPAALRGLKVLRAGLVDPFTEAGRNKIVGRALNTAAADKELAKASMRSRTGSTAGFNPTAGQAADDAGLASLERTARAIDPAGFGDIDRSQRGALVDALRSVAKTPEDRSAAVLARDRAVAPLYTEARAATVQADDEISNLLKRPSLKAAQSRAEKLAAERGEQFGIGEVDLSGTALHDLKLGLDDAIGNPGLGGMQGAERTASLGTKEKFMNWLESRIPPYAQAKNTYAEMSRPINQMDIGQELYNRFVPALADNADVPFKTRADSFAQALRNGDKLTQNVTGLNSATMASTMDPAQMQLLNGVVADSQLVGAAQNAGRGVGSDTVQKLSMSNLIDQAGLPGWVSGLKPLTPAGGWLRTAGDILYSKNDETMRHLLADVLKDPARAVEAMERAGVPPSKYAEILRMATQAGAVGAANTPNN